MSKYDNLSRSGISLANAICKLVEADEKLKQGDLSYDETVDMNKQWNNSALIIRNLTS